MSATTRIRIVGRRRLLQVVVVLLAAVFLLAVSLIPEKYASPLSLPPPLSPCAGADAAVGMCGSWRPASACRSRWWSSSSTDGDDDVGRDDEGALDDLYMACNNIFKPLWMIRKEGEYEHNGFVVVAAAAVVECPQRGQQHGNRRNTHYNTQQQHRSQLATVIVMMVEGHSISKFKIFVNLAGTTKNFKFQNSRPWGCRIFVVSKKKTDTAIVEKAIPLFTTTRTTYMRMVASSSQ